jgi:hypothetical protein
MPHVVQSPRVAMSRLIVRFEFSSGSRGPPFLTTLASLKADLSTACHEYSAIQAFAFLNWIVRTYTSDCVDAAYIFGFSHGVYFCCSSAQYRCCSKRTRCLVLICEGFEHPLSFSCRQRCGGCSRIHGNATTPPAHRAASLSKQAEKEILF